MKKMFSFLLLGIVTQLAVAQAPPPLPGPPAEDYIGKYIFPEGSVVPHVEVVMTDSVLTMHSDAGSSTLLKLGVDSFSIIEFSGTALFKRGEDKKVKAVHIEAMGYILDGEKVPGAGWSFRLVPTPARKETGAVKK